MATASALHGLGSMPRSDSVASKMIKMFKRPDTHAAFLTSSRFALDLIRVRDRSRYRREIWNEGREGKHFSRTDVVGCSVQYDWLAILATPLGG